MAVLSNEKCDLFDSRRGLESFDELVRSGIEALVIHTWYCDLWDVRADDPENWDTQMFRNLVIHVERDREDVRHLTVKQLFLKYIF